MISQGSDSPVRPVAAAWTSKIKLGHDLKKRKYQDDADEAMQFFNGPYDFLYGLKNASASRGFIYTGDDGELPRPSFAMTVNKVAELVQLFGPALYHRNPVRQVNPRKPALVDPALFGDPQDPQVQQMAQQEAQQVQQERTTDKARAGLLENYLNYTPTALDLKTHSRWAIDEAIIKGLGVLWIEVFQPAGAPFKIVGSFFDTADNLVLDPDMETRRECKWIARRRVAPFWEVEEKFELPKDSLKEAGNMESYGRQAEISSERDGDYNRKRGMTNDLIVYWEIYSKMGLGGKLAGTTKDKDSAIQKYDRFGKFIYLAVSDTVPYPLNMPPDVCECLDDEDPNVQLGAEQTLKERLRWPIPFWADDDWPFEALTFHDIPRELYPMSHIKPAMGELKFINWAYSFLAGKVKTASRDFLAIAKSAGEELKENIRVGQDYTMIEVEALHGSIDNVVKFLQYPAFNQEIYKVIEGVTHNFEKRTGLTELMYGLSHTQSRSAEDAQVKGDQVSVRPDDMANKVEDWMSNVARKEAFAARWHLTAEDVAPVMGPVAARWWERLVDTSDPAQIIHQLEYRIEAGSARKPNKARDTANMQQAMQTLMQPLMEMAMQGGQVGPINALLTAWAKSLDLDVGPFLLPPPPQQGPPPEVQKAQQEMQIKGQQHQMDLQQQAQKHAQDLQHTAQSHAQDQAHAAQQHQAQLFQGAQGMQQGAAEHMQGLVHAGQQHFQGLAHTGQEHVQGIAQAAQKHIFDLMAARNKAMQAAKASPNGGK